MTVPNALQEDKALLSTAEVAKRLGVHRSTVWLWIRRRMLKSVRVGTFHGVKRTDLKEFLGVYKISRPKRPKKEAR